METSRKIKENANIIILLFNGRKVPIKKFNFPTKVKGSIVEILAWPKTSKEGRTYYMVNKIALFYGYTHLKVTFLQLAIITSPK